jgi:Ribonuclease G/E
MLAPAKGETTIRAAWSPGEIRVAAMEGEVLVDYALWRPGSPDGIGDVYRARVTGIVPTMAGAFVALPASPPPKDSCRIQRAPKA